MTDSWPLHDYISPGLRLVRPDDAFPRMGPGDPLHHPWKYLRRDVPHNWYIDERYPLMGFMSRDEAVLLHNIALQFAGRRALEIGSWLGWSTVHLALAGVELDVIDPAHDDPEIRASVEDSLTRAAVRDRVNLAGGRSPESIDALRHRWSLFFVDGDHEAPAPLRDTEACLAYAENDCAFVFHDLASPMVASALRFLETKGFHVVVYQTAQIMAMAWRGNVVPVAHIPDPDVAWQLPPHLAGLPVSGVDFRPPQPVQRRELRDVALTGEPETPTVCIVTSELIGPFKNGGVGTAMTGLAERLAAARFPVTILYTGAMWQPDVNVERWKRHYADRGITLDALSLDAMSTLGGPLKDHGFGIPWLVYRYLADRRFDVIHFNDCCGEGSLALAAKKLGAAFTDSLLVVALHSPSRWVLELNQTLPSSPLLTAFDYAERVSLAAADVLWSPSRYLLDWVTERGFELPPQTYVQQYVLPPQPPREHAAGHTDPPSELVFFGRLEERKGLRVFCNALHLLRDDLAQRNVAVTFLGKPGHCGGLPSLDYIARRSTEWRFPTKTLTDLGQPEALAYLAERGRLAVMPSPFDNSPCTVYEALANGIPFLAANTGGIPELVAERDRERVLFAYSTEGLRNALRRALDEGGWIATPAIPFDETAATWTNVHRHWRTFLPERTTPRRPATVAAIIDHRDGIDIKPTVETLQRCPSVRRIQTINRGENKPWASLNLMTDDPEALNGELAAITEDLVLLIHSGVSVIPESFEAMVERTWNATIDGVIPAGRLHGRNRSLVIPPLGGSAAFSLFEGATFTGAMLLTRDALTRAAANRQFAVDSPFLGLADFAVVANERIWPYPEPVVERAAGVAVDARSALPARVAAYGAVSAVDRYHILAAGYGANERNRGVAGRRYRLAMAAADAGFTWVVRAGSWGLRQLRRWRREMP